MDYETIRFETSDDHVATITLDRPDALNSFDERMCNEFEHAWKHIREDDDIHAVVLRANLDSRAFCTGVDVKNGYGYDAPENPFNRRDPGEFLGPNRTSSGNPSSARFTVWPRAAPSIGSTNATS